MTGKVVRPAKSVRGELRVPGDKSIAHRGLILGSIARGMSELSAVPEGDDVRATRKCLAELGCSLVRDGAAWRVRGEGLAAWRSPSRELDCRNSGTTMRILAGALAGSRVSATLTGDASLSRRPMDRVVQPLREMGARITSRDGRAPIRVEGTDLTGHHHALPLPSAQVKTALLLAGLHANGSTVVHEPFATRDHTERLLVAMGARLSRRNGEVQIEPQREPLSPLQLSIPGDFSSAAFFFGAAALRADWTVTVPDLGLNPSRTAFLDILREMGAEVQIDPAPGGAVEPKGRVTVRGAGLRPIQLGAERVAAAIDEIAILLVVASQAEGTTTIRGAGELRFKESDRLTTMAEGLRRLGVPLEERSDGMIIEGPAVIRPAQVESAGDHRVAMALAVAGLVASGPVMIEGAEAVSVSYPEFFRQLEVVSDGGR